MMTWLLVAVAMLAVAPVVVAASGPSAGDNQYTDPLKSTTTTHATPPPTTTNAPASTGGGPAPATTTTITPPPTAVAAATTTTATGTATPAASASTGSLPRTGYESWLAALLGVGLVTTGIGIRLRYVGR